MDGYCCVGCCHFLFDNLREERSVSLTIHILNVLKILAADQLKITALETKTWYPDLIKICLIISIEKCDDEK